MESREEILIELAMALLQQMLLCSSNSVGLRRSAAGNYGLQLDVDMQRRETNFLKALLVNYQFSWAIGELLLVFFSLLEQRSPLRSQPENTKIYFVSVDSRDLRSRRLQTYLL